MGNISHRLGNTFQHKKEAINALQVCSKPLKSIYQRLFILEVNTFDYFSVALYIAFNWT